MVRCHTRYDRGRQLKEAILRFVKMALTNTSESTESAPVPGHNRLLLRQACRT